MEQNKTGKSVLTDKTFLSPSRLEKSGLSTVQAYWALQILREVFGDITLPQTADQENTHPLYWTLIDFAGESLIEKSTIFSIWINGNSMSCHERFYQSQGMHLYHSLRSSGSAVREWAIGDSGMQVKRFEPLKTKGETSTQRQRSRIASRYGEKK
jgi:hypothetical protein